MAAGTAFQEEIKGDVSMRMRALILSTIVLGAMLGRGAEGQTYVEPFDPGTPAHDVMGGVLGIGQDGAWHGRLEDGAYVLENAGEPGAIRYFWLGEIPGGPDRPPAKLPVSVEVGGTFEGEVSGGGLIFRYDPEHRSYYGFAVLSGGRYGFFERDREGVQMRLGGTSDAIEAGGTNRLAIVPEGDAMDLLINGEQVASFGNDAIQGPGVGIVAIGIGEFRFDDFVIGKAEAGSAGGDTFAAAAAPPSEAGWVEHAEPGAFRIRHPEGWQLETSDGRVRLDGPGEESVAIWPFVVGRPLSQAGGAQVLRQLAGEVAPAMRFDAPRLLAGHGLRALGRDGGRRAVASVVLTPAGDRTFGTFYLVAAPEPALRERREVYERILSSFRPQPGDAPHAAPMPAVRYTSWQDPAERAFTLEVPKGWRTEGKTHRENAIDVRQFVHARAPDGEIMVFLGDPKIPPFAEPSRRLSSFGFDEGSWYSPQPGFGMLVKRYVPGAAFAREYLGWKFGGSVEGLAFGPLRERPEIVQTFNRLARENGLPAFHSEMHAGEATFEGMAGGGPVRGYALAATEILTTTLMGEPMTNWNVAILYGFIAPEARVGEAGRILAHMVESFAYSPEWVRMQQDVTMETVRTYRETAQFVSKIIKEAHASRQVAQDATSRKFSNYIRGVVDVVDPASGESFKVESGSNYYWIDALGTKVGTDLHTNPDPQRFREMLQLP